MNIAVVNAHVLFTQVTNNKISITDLRTALVTQNIEPEPISYSQITTIKHKLIKASKSRCHKHYSIMVKEKGRQHSQKYSKITSTKCEGCDKYYCVDCFFEDHKLYQYNLFVYFCLLYKIVP